MAESFVHTTLSGIFWRRKWLLLVLMIGPVLLSVIVLLFVPSVYELTLTYKLGPEPPELGDKSILFKTDVRAGLDEKNFSLFIRRFYSSSSHKFIMERMKERGAETILKRLQKVNRLDKFQKIFSLTPKPSYMSIDDTGNLKILKHMTPELITRLQNPLVMTVDITITGRPMADIVTTGEIIRSFYEQTLPVYYLQDIIENQYGLLNARIARMESDKKSELILLDSVRGKIERLGRVLKTDAENKSENDSVIHFENVKEEYLYLPLSNQFQSLQSEAERLAEDMETVDIKTAYYLGLLEITQQILAEITKNIGNDYTLNKHVLFIDALIAEQAKDSDTLNYCNAYRRYLDSLTMFYRPATEHPEIYKKSKHSALVLGLSFFAGLFLSLVSLYFLEIFPGLIMNPDETR